LSEKSVDAKIARSENKYREIISPQRTSASRWISELQTGAALDEPFTPASVYVSVPAT
jgi:hypothetical protein